MNECKIHLGGMVTLIILFFFSFTNMGLAADCLALRKKIQQETDIIKRRELVKQGLTNCPNDPVINFKYAYSRERFRKYDDALKHYQVATKLDPKYAKAYFGMGDMYLQLNKPHQSVVAYQKGLSIDPNNKRAARSVQKALAQAKTVPAPKKVVSARKKTVSTKTNVPLSRPVTITPYNPEGKTVFQSPQNQRPVVATPLGNETIQSFTFTKAGHSDATGSLDDNLMEAN